MTDYIVVGAGLCGSVLSRHLAEQGKTVEIWERRDHIGGNMFDYRDNNGILIQKYGPHILHTRQKYLFDYMSRFEEWNEFCLKCGAEIDGKYTPTPFNFKTIDDFYPPNEAEELKRRLLDAFQGRETATVIEVLEHVDPLIRGYAQFLFEKDYSLYTAKQWGVPPSEIDVSVLKRVPLRFSYQEGYFDDDYQALPVHSYTKFFENLLNHPKIHLKLGVNAMERLQVHSAGNTIFLDGQPAECGVIYTGALDELFNCCYGPLPYRSLRFELQTLQMDSYQDAPVVAYPEAEGYTRITEYKKLPVQDIPGKTTIAIEYPLPYCGDNTAEPYYPILTKESKEAYQKYLKLAKQIPNLTICGRLADFQYYNMDQALARALKVCQDIIPS